MEGRTITEQSTVKPTIEKSISQGGMKETKTRLSPEVRNFVEEFGKRKGLRLGPQLRTIIMDWYEAQKNAEEERKTAA